MAKMVDAEDLAKEIERLIRVARRLGFEFHVGTGRDANLYIIRPDDGQTVKVNY